MNLRSTLLGLGTLVGLCASIAVQVLYVSVYVTSGAWALTGLLALGWFLLNRKAVAAFLTKKSTRYGANMALVLFLVAGILVFVNVLAHQHPWRKDLTRSSQNTLSDESRKVLGALTQPVTAYLFASLNEKEKNEDLLKRYAYVSKKFRYEFVDSERNPTRTAAMGVKRKNTVVLALGDGAKRVTVDQPGEETVTNGLVKLLRKNEISVYFTSGHGEHPLTPETEALGYSAARAELEKQGYTVKELNLFSEGKVPADAAVLIVGGPHKAFFPKELEILSAWIKGGGRAVLAADLDLDESGLAKGSKQLTELLKPWGLSVMSEMLVDPTSKMANVEPQVLLGFASQGHAITKDFPHSAIAANFLFPLTTYITHAENPAVTVSSLAATTENAWAESDWASLRQGRAVYDAARDHKGKMDLAVAVEGKKPEGQPQPSARAVKFVVFADALFASNGLIDKVGNRDLLLNSVAWLADEAQLISIRPKEDNDGVRQFNNSVVSLILFCTIFVVPLFLIGLGTFVWWRRSKL